MCSRRLGKWAHIAAITFFTAGCSPSPAVVPTPTPTPPMPTAAILEGSPPADTLRWSIEGTADVISLDPKDAGDSASVTVGSLIFGGLVRLNENLEVASNDADTWDASADGTTYTFHLRDGLVDANGDPVRTQDYVRSINRAIQPGSGSYNAATQLEKVVGVADVAAGKAKQAEGIRALDDRTLQIALTSPSAAFLQQLTFPFAFVVPQKLAASNNWAHTYGTGPYRVASWQRGQGIRLEANPHYWQGKPGIPYVQFSFTPDSDTAYQRYVAGELDIMGNIQNPLPAALLPAVRGTPDFATANALSTHYVGFNNQLPPFGDDLVRLAFAHALDREALARDVLHGEATAASRILPPGMFGTKLLITPVDFSPKAARDTLAQAGFAEGKGLPPITLTYSPEGGENEIVVRWMQEQWRENLGVEVRLEPLDSAALGKRLDETWKTPERGLQMYYSIWTADYPDPQNFLSLQLASTSPNNNGHFSDPNFDAFVAEADGIAARDQINRRLLLYNKAEQIAINRVGWLPILHTRVHMLLRPRIQGMFITPNGIVVPDWSQLSFKKTGT